jgi:protein-disulfide isomerase
MKGGLLENVATGVVAVCAVVITILMVHREFAPPANPNEPRPPVEIKDWRAYAVGNERIGATHAPVTVVEFSDFQCPFCARFSRTLERVRSRHPNDIEIVYRNMPLTELHPYARSAAIAAACAAHQGKFAEYYTLLFQHQDSLGRLEWSGLADRAGITDTASFNACLSSDAIAAAIRSDSLAAASLHVNGTPTVIVNRWRLSDGAPAEDILEQLVNKEIAATHKKSL